MIQNQNKNKWYHKYPLLICAPMVQQSQLPFRMLTRKYGSNLAYTPMLNSKIMVTQKNYKEKNFATSKQDRPLVAQLCGDNPQYLLKAAQMLIGQVDAIDLNFGCPQRIAKKGHYGSFLLQQPQLIAKIIQTLSNNLQIPIFCKMRILPSQIQTIKLAKTIQKSGCSLLTVHGRTKQQNKERVGKCNWDIIKKIKQQLAIPVVANGGIFNYDDVEQCLKYTGADGVMSAQGLLQNPALFSGKQIDLDDLAAQYLQLCKIYKPSINQIKAHLFRILYKGVQQHIDLRQLLGKASSFQQFVFVADELKKRRTQVNYQQKIGWYKRYWKKQQKSSQNPKQSNTQC